MEPFHELVAEGSDFSVLPARSLGAEIVVADGVPEATQNEGRQKAHARQIGIEASTEFIFAAGIPRRGATLHSRCQD